jgi:catechol 2,3-dioxygenase-like lactoylglutathione lyase family enzyme
VANGVDIVKPPKTHRDGARSFYCRDPDGNVVQFIHHPPIAQRC